MQAFVSISQVFGLACNLGNFLRPLALPKSANTYSLRTLREKLIKIGAKLVRHSRYVLFQMAEVVVPSTLFRQTHGYYGLLETRTFFS
jgi:hypothetical protein